MRRRRSTMADDGDDDLEALRNAVLASMKTKRPAVPTVKEDNNGSDNLRVPALKPKRSEDAQDFHHYPHGGPLDTLNPVSAVTNFPRRNSPSYREHGSAPGSPHRKPYGPRGRGGFNGPRNQGSFNAPPRSSNLIVLTAEPPKPVIKKGGNNVPKPVVQSNPIMVRPQDKWAGTNTVTETVKPEKPKGPARFSRLESDSDSDDESDVELDNKYLRKLSNSSSSESESETEDDVKEGPSKNDVSSDSGSESDKSNVEKRDSSPGDASDKSKSPEPSPPASPVFSKDTVEKEVNEEKKHDSSDNEDGVGDNSSRKPDYHCVPPPAFSPAPSPPPPRPATPSSPKATTSKEENIPVVHPQQESITKTTIQKNSSDECVEPKTLTKRISPSRGNKNSDNAEQRPVRGPTLHSEESKMAARQRRFQGSNESTLSKTVKERNSDVVPSKTKSPSDRSFDKRSRAKSPPEDFVESRINGGSGEGRVSRSNSPSHSKSPSQSPSRSTGSESESSSSFSQSESESDSDSSLRRNKYTASERNKDDIERERRLRIARERDERRKSRRSRDDSHRPNDSQRHVQSRGWPSSQSRDNPRSVGVRKKTYDETDKRDRNNDGEKFSSDRRRNREGYTSNRDAHTSGRKRFRKPSPPEKQSPNTNFKSSSESDSDNSASENRPKIRSVTQVVKPASSTRESHRNRKVTVTSEKTKKRMSDEPERLRSHSKERVHKKSERRERRGHTAVESSQNTRIIIQSDNRNQSKGARNVLKKMKDRSNPGSDDEGHEKRNPMINVTFSKDPQFEDGAKNRLPVHQRLGLPIKQKKTSPESKVRRVIAEDTFDARQHLREKRKEKDQKDYIERQPRSSVVERGHRQHKVNKEWSSDDEDEEEEDMEEANSPSPPPPPPSRGIEQRLGKRRAPSSSPERETGHSRSRGKKRSHRSIEGRLGMQSVKSVSDNGDKRKGNPIWSSRASEAQHSKHELRTEREKIQAPSKSTKKSPTEDEEALNARIKRIQEQNEVIRRRKQEVDREKERLGYR